MKVLIVDDHADLGRSMLLLLKARGFDAQWRQSGEAALELLESFRADLMLIDIAMPGIDGYELARRIRADVRFDRVVLAAQTGYGRLEDLERAWAAGFNHHLTKPVHPKVLLPFLNGLKPVPSRKPDVGQSSVGA